MERERLKEQLERILQTSLEWVKIPQSLWKEISSQSAGSGQPVYSAIINHTVIFYWGAEEGKVIGLQVEETLITPSERQLIELMLEKQVSTEKKSSLTYTSEEEKRAGLIGEWLKEQMTAGVSGSDLPESLAAQLSLYSAQVPLLLYGEYSPTRRVSYNELKKLLESFFDVEITLIPLMEKEWLILGSESLLNGALNEDRDGDEEDTIEMSLTDLCSGLHEMLANEWIGECHIAIHYPMKPMKSLLSSVISLRETMMLGKTFHVADNTHYPWKLQLEKLLNLIPDEEKESFLEQVLKRMDYVIDNETLVTLEHFFALDCNVSDTAKKLYIHRNTLLYRLDKFKGETGLDVRTFNDAVLVRIALLLYKVTKRA